MHKRLKQRLKQRLRETHREREREREREILGLAAAILGSHSAMMATPAILNTGAIVRWLLTGIVLNHCRTFTHIDISELRSSYNHCHTFTHIDDISECTLTLRVSLSVRSSKKISLCVT